MGEEIRISFFMRGGGMFNSHKQTMVSRTKKERYINVFEAEAQEMNKEINGNEANIGVPSVVM